MSPRRNALSVLLSTAVLVLSLSGSLAGIGSAGAASDPVATQETPTQSTTTATPQTSSAGSPPLSQVIVGAGLAILFALLVVSRLRHRKDDENDHPAT